MEKIPPKQNTHAPALQEVPYYPVKNSSEMSPGVSLRMKVRSDLAIACVSDNPEILEQNPADWKSLLKKCDQFAIAIVYGQLPG